MSIWRCKIAIWGLVTKSVQIHNSGLPECDCLWEFHGISKGYTAFTFKS